MEFWALVLTPLRNGLQRGLVVDTNHLTSDELINELAI